MVDNLTTTLLQQHKPLHDPSNHFPPNFVSSKEPLPYDPTLGWYTAATLSGLLLLFIACVGIEKIKDKIVSLIENRHLKRDNSIPEDSLEERAQMALMMQEPSPLCVPLQINSMPALPHHSTNYINNRDSNKSLNNFTTNHESSKSINDSNYTSLQITSNTCLSQKNTKHAAIKSSSQELHTNPDNFTLEAAIQMPQTLTPSSPCNNPKETCVKTDDNQNKKSKHNSTSQSANSIPQHFSFPSLPSPASPLLTELSNSFFVSHKKSPSSPSLPCFPTFKPFNTPEYSPIKPLSCEPCSKTSPLLDI